MKKVSIYLHQEIINILKCFGNLNDVINNLLRESYNQGIYTIDIAPAPDRSSAKRIDVSVEDEVIEMYQGLRIRPFIYYFVENELYNELGWKMINQYIDGTNEKLKRQFVKALSEVSRLKRYDVPIDDILEKLKELSDSYGIQ